MANQILIKRGTGTSALANGELGYNTSTNTLYIGNNGNKAIGGSGAFLPLSGGTISGTLILQNAQKQGHIKLYGSAEGGNFQIQGPNNKYYWEMDALNNNQLRLYCHDMDKNENYGFWMWNSDLSTLFPGKIQAPNAHFTSITGAWNGSVITTAKGGTGQDMSATPANALIRMSSAGTFWYTASANGAVYATSANGAITFGTLPVAQGGTGSTTANGACANLGAVKKSGDTMTGTLTAPFIKIYSASWPSLSLGPDANTGTGSIYQAISSRRIGMNQFAADSEYSENYLLPTPIVRSTDNVWYDILTTNNPALRGSQYWSGGNYGLNLNNSDLINANGIYFADDSNTAGEGINFYNSSTTWDTLLASGGKLYFAPNHAINAVGTRYEVYHSGGATIPVSKGGTGATTAAGARTNLQVPHLDGSVINLGGNQVGIGLRTENGGWWQFWNWGNDTEGYYVALAPTLNGKQNLGTTSMYIKNVYANNYIGSTLSLSSTADASETANNNVCIRTGSATGQHLDIDNNEIISKTDASTMGDLYLQGLRIAESGKITSGTWNGSAVGVAYGGTGKTTLTSGQALIGNGTGAITTRAITDNTSVGALISSSSWTSNNSNLVTLNTLAFWNGAHAGNHSNLSKLATVTTGTWQATAIGVGYGGTGATTAAGARTNLEVPHFKDGIIDLNNLEGIGTSKEDGQWLKIWNLEHTASDGTKSYPAGLVPTKDGVQVLGTSGYKFKDIYALNFAGGTWNGNTIAVNKGGTGATNMLGAQANLLTTDSSKITATTNLNTILQTGRFKMEGNASTTYNWPANATGARCLIIQEGALNSSTYGYWKQTAHMLGQHRTYSRNYHWDHWMEWKMDYNEETLVYSTSQPTNGYKGRIWLKPI